MNKRMNIIFDQDGTLDDPSSPSISEENLKLVNQLANIHNVSILTGNDIKAVKTFSEKVKVFANRGIYQYRLRNNQYEQSRIFDKTFKIPKEDFSFLADYISRKLRIPFSKIQLRDDVIVGIKPLSELERNRLIVDTFLKKIAGYEIQKTGKTTVEIAKKGLDKLIAFKHYFDKISAKKIYVGNEVDGNDKPIIDHQQTEFLHVNSVVETNVFLKELLWQF